MNRVGAMSQRSGTVLALVLILSSSPSTATGGAQKFLAAKQGNDNNGTVLQTGVQHEPGRASLSTNSVDHKGFVNSIFTLGAPGTSVKPLPNMKRDDRCFLGSRVWTMEQVNHPLITCADFFTQAANGDDFWHARMETVALLNPSQKWPSSASNPEIFKCDSHSDTTLVTVDASLPKPSTAALITKLPASNPLTALPCGVPLHPPENTYIPWTQNSRRTDMLKKYPESLMLEQMSNDDVAYNMKWENAQNKLKTSEWNTGGYKMVGCARASSGLANVTKKKQPSYLLQNGSADCILTFKGTTPTDQGDVQADKDIAHTTFCGWEDVHRGFADHLRLMVSAMDGGFTDSTWKRGVLDRLPKCRSLTVLGHSLGGAMAELFSYCANVESSQGLEGQSLKDWQAINWQQGTPEIMDDYTGEDQAC